MKHQRGFIGPIILIVLIGFFGFVLFVLIPGLSKGKESNLPQVGETLSIDQDVNNWIPYTSGSFKLHFRYPKGFTVVEGNKRPGNVTGDVTIANGKISFQIVGYGGVHGTPLLVTEGILVDEVMGKKYIVAGNQTNSVSGVTVELTKNNQPISFILYPDDDPRRNITPLELRLFDLFLTTISFQ